MHDHLQGGEAPSRPPRAHAGALAGAPGHGAWRTRALIAALCLLALAVRLSDITRSPFTDEVFSIALAQRGFGHMLALWGWEANGTLYSLVLWPVIRVLGDGTLATRLPALAAGVAAVPAVWWAARTFAGERAAWIGAALMAVNPMAVFYGHQARAYSFVVLASCLAFGALGRCLAHQPGRPARARLWVLYVAAMVAMAYSDLFAAPLALPAQALMAWRAGPAARRAWLRSLLALLVCCVPLLIASAISRSRRDALYWLPKTDRSLVELAVQEMSGGFSKVSAVGWLSLLAAVVLVAIATWRPRLALGSALRSPFAVAVAWGVLPVVLMLVVSRAVAVFQPRYVILSLPGLFLLVGLAAERALPRAAPPGVGRTRSPGGLARAAAAGACVLALVALALFADWRQRHYVQEEWRPVAAWLRAQRAPGEPTIVDTVSVLSSLGYLDPAYAAREGDVVIREWGDRPLPPGVVGYKDPTGYGGVPDGPPSAASFAALARRDGTVWMVVSEVDRLLQPDPETGAAVAWARAHCTVRTRTSVGVWVMRASGCPTG